MPYEIRTADEGHRCPAEREPFNWFDPIKVFDSEGDEIFYSVDFYGSTRRCGRTCTLCILLCGTIAM